MKFIITALLLVAAFSSCKKSLTSPSAAPARTAATFEPTKQYDIKFKADDQQVVVDNFKKQDTVLSMTYYEKVALIVRKEDYDNSWAIRFEENFKGTALDGMLYQTLNQQGAIVYDYLETNLNGITLQSKSDTIINGNSYLNLKVNRVITFLQAYPTKAITDQTRTALLARRDIVTHSAYYTFNNTGSVPTSGTTAIVYVKP